MPVENPANQVAVFDPKTKQINHNPTYEQLFQPEVGNLWIKKQKETF